MSEHAQNNEVVLEVEGVTKRFPGVLANDHVDLALRRGEILALLGENGAGKSTLMNIIYGLYHPDEGTIRLKGQEVRFASPREAIHSGIGMVHQHFQLVPVMTVAENVVLGEEGTVAYQGRDHSILRYPLRWLPSLIVFLLSLVIGASLGDTKYVLWGAGIGAALGVVVAQPPLARLVWGIAWRAGLALVVVAVVGQIEVISEVGLTAIALRQQVETVEERRPKEMEGYIVSRTVVHRERIPFNWSAEGRQAEEDGTGVRGVMDSARAQLEPYRDQGVPAWLLDAIDDYPPVIGAISLALLAAVAGAYSLTSWRGLSERPVRLTPLDMVPVALLAAWFIAQAWINLGHVSRAAQVGLIAVVLAGLLAAGFRLWRRGAGGGQISPLDGVIDAVLSELTNAAEIYHLPVASRHVREFSRQYGLEVDPDAVIEKLPVGMQQRVEILKALYRKADILILDEPTAVLTPQESRELFKTMRDLAAQGVSIVFITHKLKEVFEVATHIVVMRGGQVVGATTPAQATEKSLAAMMVGREVILQVEKAEACPAEGVLIVDGLSALDNRGADALRGVSFKVCAGEVLGIAGVQGNGQTELVEVLTGLRDPSAGSVNLLGNELQPDRQPPGTLRQRAISTLIDLGIVGLLSYFVGYFVWYFNDDRLYDASTLTQVVAALVVMAVVDAIYTLAGWMSSGGTMAGSLFALQIADERDKKPATLRLVQRYLITLVLKLTVIPGLITAALAARDPQGQTWFDRVLGLRVIRREGITPRRIKDYGTSHIPEDRQRHGLVKVYTVADNLVLNDYYERPFATTPNTAELPGALLRYLLLTGAIIAGLTVLALYVWDRWLWEQLLEAYHVPPSMREIGASLTGAQRGALQYPFLISILLLIGAEVLFAALAHETARRLLGAAPVRHAVSQINGAWRRIWWGLARRQGDPVAPRGGLLRDAQAVRRHASGLIEQFDIRTPSADTPGGNLSGGNQQKMIVAREFSRKPRLLIAAQPTRGIDVGSIEFIHRQIIEQRDANAAVLLVSAELDEIMALSDRIAVIYKGEIIDTLDAKSATREQLGLLMAGIR